MIELYRLRTVAEDLYRAHNFALKQAMKHLSIWSYYLFGTYTIWIFLSVWLEHGTKGLVSIHQNFRLKRNCQIMSILKRRGIMHERIKELAFESGFALAGF